jgi:hypothetical protein
MTIRGFLNSACRERLAFGVWRSTFGVHRSPSAVHPVQAGLKIDQGFVLYIHTDAKRPPSDPARVDNLPARPLGCLASQEDD